MNILHICGTKRLAGRELFVFKQTLRMREDGHFVGVVARQGFGLGEIAQKHDIPCVLYKSGLNRLWFPFQVRKFISEHSIDVVHFHQLRMVRRLMPFLPSGSERPVYIFTDAAPHPRKISSWFTSKVLKRLDLLLVPSGTQKGQSAWALDYPEEKIQVLENGVDTSEFAPPKDADEKIRIREELGIPEKAFAISVMGRIDRDKGQDILLKAAEILINKGRKDIYVDVCGRLESNKKGQKYIEEVKKLAASDQLKGTVHLRGFVEDVPRYLKAVDLSVLPSTYESFGFVIAEAMSAALPVIATNTGALPYIVDPDNCGFIVEHSSPQELADAIEKLLDNRSLAEEMGQRGRKRVKERFSLKRHLSEAYAYYEGFNNDYK